jgi:hypothetical protein
MTLPDDPWDAMASLLSPDQVEQLLTGTAVPGELDAGASRIAQLLSTMHLPVVSTGAGMEEPTVAAMVAAIREAPRPIAATERPRMLTKLKSVKAAVAAATLVTLFAGGTAAAATGSLPVPAQSAVASALAHVGVSVPGPNSHANPHATDNPHRAGHGHNDATDPTGGAKGPDATGDAKYGLCQAWAATPTPNAHSHKRDSVAFTNLQKAAHDAGMSVADYCRGVTPPTGTGETNSSAPTRAGHPPTTAGHGPPVSTPNSGGTAGSANSTTHTPDHP